MPTEPTPAHERIIARVLVTEGGCWEFQGARDPRGYGRVQLGRGIGTALTHRVIWEKHRGPIPGGLTLDHLCANPPCCNPDHLEPVTLAENTSRQWSERPPDPGRNNRAKTHCPHGHPYDVANTIWFGPDGRWRRCRECVRRNQIKQRKRRAKK